MRENDMEKNRAKRAGTVLLITLMISTIILNWNICQAASTGRIVGKVVSAENGEPLIGAAIVLEGNQRGAQADLDGEYVINDVPPGKYRLVISTIGYIKKIVEDVNVTPDCVLRFDVSLKPTVLEGEEQIVTAQSVHNTESSLLTERAQASSVTDAIASQTISKTGSSNAAGAMTRVTGASVVSGKYVLVRGLGGRYANIMLNGSTLPAADQSRQSVQLDIIPANLLDNIIVQKTATPDKSGDFSGGSIDLNTKAIPDGMTLSFSMSSSYNTDVSLKDGLLTFPGGSRQWLGTDASFYSRPAIFSQPGFSLPFPAGVQAGDSVSAYMIDAATKSLNNTFGFSRRSAPLNQSYAFSFGNQYSLWEHPLGVMASASYSRNWNFYDDGTRTRWAGGGTSLWPEYSLTDVKGSDDVLVGTLASLAYQASPSSKLSLIYNRNQSASKLSRYMYGEFLRDFTEDEVWETRVLQYTQRSMDAFQLEGQHLIKPLRISWKGSYSRNTQDDPDRRFFSSAISVYEGDTTYLAGEGATFGGFPSHYWRYMDESNKEGQIDFVLPLGRPDGGTKLKFGAGYRDKNRDQTEYMYSMASQATDILPAYNGNPNDYYADSLLGVIGIDSLSNKYIFGRVVKLYPIFGNYTGTQKITSAYTMAEIPLVKNVNLIGGVRFESTSMDVLLLEKTKPEGKLKSDDWLPSVNLVWHLQKDMNLRGAFGMTLARPTLREMAPFGSWEFLNDYIFVGNPNLHRTLVYNYDLRWEWFTSPGEVIAISGFYKKFIDPIEKYITDYNDNATWNNVADASVYGVEFELRQSLSMIHALRNFSLSGNLTLASSRVALTEQEYESARFYDPNASKYRDFGGQSNYLINADLSYENSGTGTSATLVYNVFGRRLVENVEGRSPNVYEEPFHSLDLITSQRIFGNVKAKFGAKNLLNDRFQMTQTLPDKVYIAQEYAPGKTYSLGISYDL